MTAATAITINRSVARIGEIPFFDLNILFKTNPPLQLDLLANTIFNKYEVRILILIYSDFEVSLFASLTVH